MHAVLLASQVLIQLVGIERCKGSQQLADSHQTGVKRLIGRALVVTHLLAPETFAVQADIPVGQVVIDEGVNQSSCPRGVVVLQFFRHLLHQRVQARQYPAVNLRPIWFCRPRLSLGVRDGTSLGVRDGTSLGVRDGCLGALGGCLGALGGVKPVNVGIECKETIGII